MKSQRQPRLRAWRSYSEGSYVTLVVEKNGHVTAWEDLNDARSYFLSKDGTLLNNVMIQPKGTKKR